MSGLNLYLKKYKNELLGNVLRGFSPNDATKENTNERGSGNEVTSHVSHVYRGFWRGPRGLGLGTARLVFPLWSVRTRGDLRSCRAALGVQRGYQLRGVIATSSCTGVGRKT